MSPLDEGSWQSIAPKTCCLFRAFVFSWQIEILMDDPLLGYRGEIPDPRATTYLISNSLGAMPRGVAGAMREYTDMWATRGVRAWTERWWMLAREVGDRSAR